MTIQGSSEAVNYDYDAAGRLQTAQDQHGQHPFRYDPAGNRLTSDSKTHQMDNRLVNDERYHYEYDCYGNLTQKSSLHNINDTHLYAYDSSHRLLHYQRRQGEQVEHARYCYDPMGRRVSKTTYQADASGQAIGQPQQTWYGWS